MSCGETCDLFSPKLVAAVTSFKRYPSKAAKYSYDKRHLMGCDNLRREGGKQNAPAHAFDHDSGQELAVKCRACWRFLGHQQATRAFENASGTSGSGENRISGMLARFPELLHFREYTAASQSSLLCQTGNSVLRNSKKRTQAMPFAVLPYYNAEHLRSRFL